MTHVERKEELKLLISFEDAKWICSTLWKQFFNSVADSESNKNGAKISTEDFEQIIENLNPCTLSEK